MEILTYVILFITLVLLITMLSMVWPPDSPWSPWWRTNKNRSRLICKFAKVEKNETILDLGSGDGTLLITASKEFGAQAIGVEIDPLRVWISKISIFLNGQSKNVKIIRKNFFDVDISKTDILFMYLIPKTLARLKPKLLEELKPGTRIVTFVYKIDLPIIKQDPKNEFYLYQIPKSKK